MERLGILWEGPVGWELGKKGPGRSLEIIGGTGMGCSEYVWTLIMGPRLDLEGLEGSGMGSVRETHLKKQGAYPDWMRSKRYL